MTAVILAGGKGTRLRPFTITIPKPLLPIGDIPIIEVVLAQLGQEGFKRVVITLGHMAHLFSGIIGDGSRWGLRVEYCMEEEPLGTAGPLRLIDDLPDNFVVMNGDLLTSVSYRSLVELHRNNGCLATIGIRRREVKIDYGVIERDQHGHLREYVEKPVIPYAVSMGINVLSKPCLEYIPRGEKFDMPQLMMALHAAGKRVYCHEMDCYWQDIGRFDDYQQASADFLANPKRFIRG